MQFKNKYSSFSFVKSSHQKWVVSTPRSERAMFAGSPRLIPLQFHSYVSTPVLTLRTPSGPLVSRLKVILREKIGEGLVGGG